MFKILDLKCQELPVDVDLGAFKLQNNQDIWVWLYRTGLLQFQVGISLQQDDAHYIQWSFYRKDKITIFSPGEAKSKAMKTEHRRAS